MSLKGKIISLPVNNITVGKTLIVKINGKWYIGTIDDESNWVHVHPSGASIVILTKDRIVSDDLRILVLKYTVDNIKQVELDIPISKWEYVIGLNVIDTDKEIWFDLSPRLEGNMNLIGVSNDVIEITYSFREMIDFAIWYSGMTQQQVVNAWNRYVLEVRKKP